MNLHLEADSALNTNARGQAAPARLAPRLGAWECSKRVPKGVEYELKRLQYEIANSANRSAMAALMNLVPTSQIMFGSDYPFVPTGVTATGMTTLGLSASDLQEIGRDNAIGLFPRLKSA